MEICFMTTNIGASHNFSHNENGTLTALRIKALIRHAVCNFILATFRHIVHAGSGVHTVLCNGYTMGNAGYFAEIRRLWIEADDLSPPTVEDKSSQIVAYCLIKQRISSILHSSF